MTTTREIHYNALPAQVATHIGSFCKLPSAVSLSWTCRTFFIGCRVYPGTLAAAHRQFDHIDHAFKNKPEHIPFPDDFTATEFRVLQLHFKHPQNETHRAAALALCARDGESKAERRLESFRLFNVSELDRDPKICFKDLEFPEGLDTEKDIAKIDAFNDDKEIITQLIQDVVYKNKFIFDSEFVIYYEPDVSFTNLYIIDKCDSRGKATLINALEVPHTVWSVIPPIKMPGQNGLKNPLVLICETGRCIVHDFFNDDPTFVPWEDPSILQGKIRRVHIFKNYFYVGDGKKLLKIDRCKPEDAATIVRPKAGEEAMLQIVGEDCFLKYPEGQKRVSLMESPYDDFEFELRRTIPFLPQYMHRSRFQSYVFQQNDPRSSIFSLFTGACTHPNQEKIKSLKLTNNAVHAWIKDGKECCMLRWDFDLNRHSALPTLEELVTRNKTKVGNAAADA